VSARDAAHGDRALVRVVHGDGRADLLVGLPDALVSGMRTDMAFLYRGAAVGLELTASRSFSGVTPAERFAESLR